ncbi:MAG: hypothetical protein M3421_10040 [Bacteroidota bacterium]|nr:hypothetical protein [Bacteroidota bacterium]
MKIILILISLVGLILTILPSLLVFTGRIEFSTHKDLMLLGTFLWFISAPFWLNKSKSSES